MKKYEKIILELIQSEEDLNNGGIHGLIDYFLFMLDNNIDVHFILVSNNNNDILKKKFIELINSNYDTTGLNIEKNIHLITITTDICLPYFLDGRWNSLTKDFDINVIKLNDRELIRDLTYSNKIILLTSKTFLIFHNILRMSKLICVLHTAASRLPIQLYGKEIFDHCGRSKVLNFNENQYTGLPSNYIKKQYIERIKKIEYMPGYYWNLRFSRSINYEKFFYILKNKINLNFPVYISVDSINKYIYSSINEKNIILMENNITNIHSIFNTYIHGPCKFDYSPRMILESYVMGKNILFFEHENQIEDGAIRRYKAIKFKDIDEFILKKNDTIIEIFK